MGLEYKDLVGIMKPTVFVDEFESKVGSDDEYVVLSFYVRSELAADDLVKWFESGYKWVIDADRSPGEIKPNRYLVFVEMKRRMHVPEQLIEMIEDLESLTEFTLTDWKITFDGNDYPADADTLRNILILSPKEYREIKEIDLNEMRTIAGLPTKNIYNSEDTQINELRTLAQLKTKTNKITDKDLSKWAHMNRR